MADETDSASASTSVVVPVDSKKVLVVGGGCAGLGCAWHLNRSGVDVTLYEKHSKVGGHANTIHGKRGFCWLYIYIVRYWWSIRDIM